VTVRVARQGDSNGARGEATVRCRYLVDASGRDGFLARRLGVRSVDPELKKVGLHAWYEGVTPLPEGHEGDLRLISLEDEGWAWLIPLDDRTTSVGAVVGKERYDALPGTPADGLDTLLAAVPALPPLLADARRISEVRIDGDYSYATSEYAGERWLLAGDAGSFLDPVFSTGVLLALSSGVQAARAVDGALGEPGSGAEAPEERRRRLFAAYDKEQHRVYRYFRRYVTRYERPELRDFLVSSGEVLGMGAAINTVLAGNVRPSWTVRLRLQLFFFFVWLQRHRPVVPRIHGPMGTT
jgi:flavin-dependent dehydrogenase